MALQPDAIRLEYFKRIAEFIARAKARVDRDIVPLLDGLVTEARAERGDRFDAPDRVNAAMDKIADDFWEKSFRPSELEAIARQYAERTSTFQKAQLDRQASAALGANVFAAEPHLEPLIKAFVAENVALIKSVPNQYFDDIEKAITAGVRAGARATEIARTLVDKHGVAESRAVLIANDQVGKFYGELNRVRQKALGATHYIWRTSNDNRVRERHRMLEGQRFSWGKPPAEGHPGYAVNCRCNAEPDFSAILEAETAKKASARARKPRVVKPAVPTPAASTTPATVTPVPISLTVPKIPRVPRTTAAQQRVLNLAAQRDSEANAPSAPAEFRKAFDRAKITVNLPPDALKSILAAGKLKTIWELDSNVYRGEGYREDRDKAEKLNFPDLKKTERPLYGALHTPAIGVQWGKVTVTKHTSPDGAAADYGEMFFTLKKATKARSTVASDDTFSTTSADISKLTSEQSADVQHSLRSKGNREYFEVQIWGGVDLKKDVQSLTVHNKHLQNPEIAATVDSYRAVGIKIRVYDDNMVKKHYEKIKGLYRSGTL